MDIEKLIELVREYPVLYDTSHMDYMRTKMKDELWDTIGGELEATGKYTGRAVKEQWRKLRECHREALRRQKKKKSGDGTERQRPWIYQSQMEFLLPFMKNRLTQSNLEDSSQCTTPPTVEADVDIIAEEDESLPLPPSNEEAKSEPIENDGPPPRKKAKNREEQSFWQQIVEKQQPDYQNDALYLFFLSMYSTTKGLPARYQRQVRNKIHEVVSQAEEECEYEHNQSTL